MIRIITILFFLFLKFYVYSQSQWIPHIVIKDIDSLEIVDEDFKPILDTVISIEKQRWYYKGYKIYFSIAITNSGEIHIETAGTLYVRDTLAFGMFFYNGEKFLVENYDLGDKLFKKTGIKMKQDFKFWINEETGKTQEIFFLDHNASMWFYKYNDEGKLELIESVNTE